MSFSDFWQWIDQHPIDAFLFRGQGSRSDILPKIGRPEYGYVTARETALFNAFRRSARSYTSLLTSDWEWLALAQHHGAPTRLTDWSTSPLVAAWFAVTSYPFDTDAVIYALPLDHPEVGRLDIATGMTDSGTKIDDPLGFSRDTYLIETAPVSARITTQRGIFTVHGTPTRPLRVDEDYVVPQGQRSEFQRRLLGLGIDASHIFPDLDGLCRTLDWRLRSGLGFSALT